MAVTLPIVNDSEGVWGTILNDAITDIDNRLVAATNTNGTQTTDITALTTRVQALENAPSAVGWLAVVTSTTLPTPAVGQITLETDTGYLSYVARIGGTPTRVPWPGSVLCKVRQTTAQTLAPSTNVTMNFQDVIYNRAGFGASGTSKFTAPYAGQYEFTGAISFEPNATGYRRAQWLLGGASIPGATAIIGPSTGASPLSTIVVARPLCVSMAAGQYVELVGAQNAGASVSLDTDVSVATYCTSMTVKYLGSV